MRMNKLGNRGRRYPGSLLSEALKKTKPKVTVAAKNWRRGSVERPTFNG